MSILGEYLQQVKAERDEALKLLREAAADKAEGLYGIGTDAELCDRINAFLSRYDLPEDYDEA